MQKVLFVCGNYDPYPSANGVCVLRLQEALLAKGIKSDVVCTSDTAGVTENRYGLVYHIVIPSIKNGFLRKLVRLFIWPIKDLRLVSEYKKAIAEAAKGTHYQTAIAVLRPIEGALACAQSTEYVIYECDSITNNGDNEFGLKHILSGRVDRLERKLYQKAKHIFHMACHSAYYSQKKYLPFASKSEVIDIPQLVDEGIKDHASNHSGRIEILYSGTLSRDTRSPEYAISLLKALAKQLNERLEANFFSRGNCEDMLETAQAETNGIIHQCGYVSLETLNQAVAETDFLLSIGNSFTGTVTSLPSKVISYMAYGKPIIHIDGGDNDTAKAYLDKYPLTLVISPKHDVDSNASLTAAFIRKTLNQRVDLDTVRGEFALNTPDYTVDRILKIIIDTD